MTNEEIISINSAFFNYLDFSFSLLGICIAEARQRYEGTWIISGGDAFLNDGYHLSALAGKLFFSNHAGGFELVRLGDCDRGRHRFAAENVQDIVQTEKVDQRSAVWQRIIKRTVRTVMRNWYAG